MKRFSGPRKTANLPESVHEQLTMYALAASAAGVGVLALVQPVEAKIVYKPADIPINVAQGFVKLDLNNDGINDFSFYATLFTVDRGLPLLGGTVVASLAVEAAQQSNRIFPVDSKGKQCAAALKSGRKVGPHSPFGNAVDLYMAVFRSGGYNSSRCPWRPVMQAYLGLKFMVKGKFHFGWARVKREPSNSGFPAIITGYGYETIPNKPIIAGKTHDADDVEKSASASLMRPAPEAATLGLFALGAPGLSIWRRKECGLATCGFTGSSQ